MTSKDSISQYDATDSGAVSETSSAGLVITFLVFLAGIGVGVGAATSLGPLVTG